MVMPGDGWHDFVLIVVLPPLQVVDGGDMMGGESEASQWKDGMGFQRRPTFGCPL